LRNSPHVGSRPLGCRLLHTWVATVLLVLAASVAYPQTPTTNEGSDTPVFRLQIWGYIVADFSARVSRYYELRTTLESGLPAQTVSNDPAEIRKVQRALAKRIRSARDGAKQGAIFTPTISAEFKKVLAIDMDDNTLAAIMDDNPGEFSHPINGDYRDGKPYSTVPPNILAVLPTLPDDIQYRFLGHQLILLDTKANVILDRIPCAIPCSNSLWTCIRHFRCGDANSKKDQP
jgi:hypothetical protein